MTPATAPVVTSTATRILGPVPAWRLRTNRVAPIVCRRDGRSRTVGSRIPAARSPRWRPGRLRTGLTATAGTGSTLGNSALPARTYQGKRYRNGTEVGHEYATRPSQWFIVPARRRGMRCGEGAVGGVRRSRPPPDRGAAGDGPVREGAWWRRHGAGLADRSRLRGRGRAGRRALRVAEGDRRGRPLPGRLGDQAAHHPRRARRGPSRPDPAGRRGARPGRAAGREQGAGWGRRAGDRQAPAGARGRAAAAGGRRAPGARRAPDLLQQRVPAARPRGRAGGRG